VIGPAKQDTSIQPMVGSPPKAASPTRLTLVLLLVWWKLLRVGEPSVSSLKHGGHNLMTEESLCLHSFSVIVRVR
jgi:hypothetical protein